MVPRKPFQGLEGSPSWIEWGPARDGHLFSDSFPSSASSPRRRPAGGHHLLLRHRGLHHHQHHAGPRKGLQQKMNLSTFDVQRHGSISMLTSPTFTTINYSEARDRGVLERQTVEGGQLSDGRREAHGPIRCCSHLRARCRRALVPTQRGSARPPTIGPAANGRSRTCSTASTSSSTRCRSRWASSRRAFSANPALRLRVRPSPLPTAAAH